jgi:hypothetical protein
MLPSANSGFVWPLGIPRGGGTVTPGGSPSGRGSLMDVFGGSSPTGNPSGQGLAGVGTQGSIGASGNFGGINFGASLPGGLSATIPGLGGVNASLLGGISPTVDTGNPTSNSLVSQAISAAGRFGGFPTSFNVLAAMLAGTPAGAILGAINPALAVPAMTNLLGSLISHQMDLNGIPTTNAILSGILGLTQDPETMNALTQTMTPAEIQGLQNARFTQAFGPSGSVLGNTAPGQTSLFGAQGGGFAPGGLGYGGYSGLSGDPSAPGAVSLGGIAAAIAAALGLGDSSIAAGTSSGGTPGGPAGDAGVAGGAAPGGSSGGTSTSGSGDAY